MSIKASDSLRQYIKSREGFRSRPYEDSTGKITVGYGDTEGEMTVVSEEEANRRLEERLKYGESILSKNLTRRNFTPSQADVLLDMEYNIGFTKLKEQGFIDLVNRGTDEQIGRSILKFNKARNKETGQLEVVEGLNKRARERAEQWGYTAHLLPMGKEDPQAPDIYSEFNPRGITEEDYVNFMETTVEAKVEDDMYSNFRPAEVQKPVDLTASRKTDLSITGQAFDPAEAQSIKEAKKFSNEQKIPFNQAEALIFERDPKSVKLERIENDLARWFTTTADWAKQMDNYALLKESPQAVTRIETASKSLNKNFIDALGREIKNNRYQLEDSYTLANALFGGMSPKQAAKALEESDIAATDITADTFRDDKGRIAKKWMNLSKSLGKTTASFGRAIEAATTGNESVIAELAKTFDGSLESSYRLWDAFEAMATDPKATALLTAQNLSSLGVSAAGATAGAVVGFLTPVPGGATAGSTYGSGIATAAFTFGLHAKELIQENYTDPVTGKVLYEVALSDPKFVNQLRARGLLYAGVMGLVDSKFTSIAGKGTGETIKRLKETPLKNSYIKKSLIASKEFGKGILTQTMGEGISEVAASVASSAAGGELTAQKAGEIVGKGVEEAAMSLGTGLGMETAGTTTRLITSAIKGTNAKHKRTATESIHKTTETIKNAKSASSSYNGLQNLRKTIEEANLPDSDLQIEDLINRAVVPQDAPVSTTDIIDDAQLENAVNAQEKNIDEIDSSGFVKIYPSDWEAFHNDAGIDPNEAITKLGDDIVNEYANAKETDSSISVPIGKWVLATRENPDIDAIAYINENKMNAVEATQGIDALEKNPLMFFDQTAYHGSPYDFEKFSTQKIGTGEGAQAFGYGLYFTEDKDIAEWYRKKLSGSRNNIPSRPSVVYKMARDLDLKNKISPLGLASLAKAYISYALDHGDANFRDFVGGMTAQEAIDNFFFDDIFAELISSKFSDWERLATLTDEDLAYDKKLEGISEEFLQPIREYAKQQISKNKGKGQVYEVNLKTEKENMLDWDAPFIMQSPYVKERLRQFNLHESTTGESFYKSFGNPRETSWRLARMGIPGIKYQAQGGRSDKQNFVIFSDQDVEITQKFYDEMEVPPVIPGEQAEDFIPVAAQEIDKMELRPVELYNRFRSDSEKNAFKKLNRQLKESVRGIKEIDPKSLEILAEIQYRHLRSRAELIGTTVEELVDKFDFKKSQRATVPDAEGKVTAGFFQPPKFLGGLRSIFFTKFASTKTLVHELGHSWIHEMTEDWAFINNIPDDQLRSDQREYKKAMEIAADLYGIDSIDQFYNRPESQVTAFHEKFAQTTERYFLEGKFENSKIRQLMEMFRKWMVKVAHMVGRSYPEYGMFDLTPEVERMFDAILDANDKVEQELYPMFPEPFFPDEFLGTDNAKYLDLLSAVKSQAIGKLTFEMMKAPLKEREAMISKAITEFNKEAENIVDRLPSMKLLKKFTEYYNQYKKGELESSPRISYESFKKLLASNDEVIAMQLKEKIPMVMIEGKKKGGVDVELVMQQMGVTDPKEMLNMLLQAGMRDDLINETVNDIIDKKIPLFKSDAEIHAIAVKAMNSAGKEQVILEEFKILADKFKPQLRALIAKGVLPSSLLGTKEAKKVIENKGLDIALDAPIAKYNYARFLKDSNNHGKNAAANFKKGNILEAFDEKYKEAIHFAAYKKAIEIKRMLAESKALMDNFSKLANDPSKANKFDTDLMRYGDVILGYFKNGIVNLPKLSLEGFADESGISPEHVEIINQMIDKLSQTSKGRGGKDASVLTYLTFGEILKKIKKFASDAKKVEIGGQEINRQEAIARLIQEVGDVKPNDVGFKTIEVIENTLLSLRPVRSELASLFPNDAAFEQSVIGMVYNDITTAEAVRNERLDTQRQKIIDAVREATKSEDKTIKALVRPITNLVGSYVLNAPPKPVRLTNLGVTLESKAELYMLLLETGSASGLEKVLRGGVKNSGPLAGYNMDTGEIDASKLQADIDALIEAGELKKKDFDMLQTIWDAFEEFYPDLEKSIRRTDGRRIGYIKGRSIKTPFGEYRGGYVPISSESYATTEALKSLRSPDNTLFKANDFYPYMDISVTKQRTQQFYDVNLDFSRITAKLAGVANIAYLREPLLNAGKIFGSPEVYNAIEKRRPGFYDASLIPFFDRTKLQQFSEPSTELVHRFSKILRSNMNMKFYFGNVATGLKQFLGLSNAVPLVGANRLAVATLKLTHAPITTLNYIASKDLRMKQMFENHHINQIKSFERLDTNFDWLSEAKAKYLMPIAFGLIKYAQNYTSAIVWLAGYQKATEAGLSEKQAINFATNAVKNSQGSTTVSDMAAAQFGKDAWKLFTAFSIVPVTGGAEIYKAYMRGGMGEKGIANVASRVGYALTIGSMTVIVPAILNSVVSEMFKTKGEKEEEEEKRIRQRKSPEQFQAEKNQLLAKQMTLDFVDQLIPIYGKILARPLLYNDVSISPIIDNVTQDIETAIRGKKVAEQGAELNAREFESLMNVLTYGTGLPFTIIGKAEKMSEKSMPKSEKVAKAKKRRATLKRAKQLERTK